MNEKWVMCYNESDEKWELYDSTYDITIHCKNQKEQNEILSRLKIELNVKPKEWEPLV